MSGQGRGRDKSLARGEGSPEDRSDQSGKDELFELEEPPRIPDGKYLLRCFDGDVRRYSFGRRGTLRFQVVEGEQTGAELPFHFTVPEPRKPVPVGSKFFKATRLLQNSHRLERRDRLSLRLFIGHTFLGLVRTTDKSAGEERGYSVVDQLVERVDRE